MNSYTLGRNVKMVWSNENSLALPQKLNIETPCDPALSLQGVYPREKEMCTYVERHECLQKDDLQ